MRIWRSGWGELLLHLAALPTHPLLKGLLKTDPGLGLGLLPVNSRDRGPFGHHQPVPLLAAAYIGTCAWASEKDAILPNVSVAGIDVSNMVVEQARSTVQSAVTERGKDIT